MNYWDYAGKTFDLPHRTRSRFSGSTNLDYLTHFRTHKETPISFVSKTDKLFLTTHPTCTGDGKSQKAEYLGVNTMMP